MTDLTEKWKKGELPSGYYYVKNEFGNIFPSDYSENYDCISDRVIKDFFTEVSEIKEVLEPVPSYDEWMEKTKSLKVLAEAYCKEKQQNAQVKELLKECQHILNEQNFYRNTPVETDTIYRTRCLKKQELLAKIDEVLK
jgi:hypothetical protein